MGKIKYYLRRLFSMHYGQMLDAVKTVHARSGKSRIVIFFDMILCSVKYLAGYMDYLVFDFETLTAAQRKTFITRGVNNAYISRLNDPAASHKFNNKVEFNRIFADLIGRDWLDLTASDKADFAEFVQRNPIFMVKPVDALCGKDIEKIRADAVADTDELYDRLIRNGQTLAEEFVVQAPEMSRLFPGSVNTVRVVTARVKGKTTVMFRALRIGNGDNVVDNFNHGGMYTVIDPDGMIRYPAIDKKGTVYKRHPATGTEIVGYQIPQFDEVLAMAERAAEIVPEVGLVGWDIAVTERGPVMIEGNHLPGHDIYQSKVHLFADKQGMKPFFDSVIFGEEGENA